MSPKEVCEHILHQIDAAKRRGDVTHTPGGFYYPISFSGKDGYAVVNEGVLITLLPEKWCPEVNATRNRMH